MCSLGRCWQRSNDSHDDVIKWKHFPRYWPFVRGIHRSPVNFPHKGQWRRALMFSFICAWINGPINNREAGDLGRHPAHYDVIVMAQMRLAGSICTRGTAFTVGHRRRVTAVTCLPRWRRRKTRLQVRPLLPYYRAWIFAIFGMRYRIYLTRHKIMGGHPAPEQPNGALGVFFRRKAGDSIRSGGWLNHKA